MALPWSPWSRFQLFQKNAEKDFVTGFRSIDQDQLVQILELAQEKGHELLVRLVALYFGTTQAMWRPTVKGSGELPVYDNATFMAFSES